MNRKMLPAQLAPCLLPWFEAHGRRNLPWQREPTPYRVWISEVMLQQTRVETVIPYFERFMARFPDVATLASAELDEALRVWSGLGYYARARHLHQAAKLVVAHHDGCLPESFDALTALPGIGRSTAGAILALARGQRHAILDGNVKRVLARVFVVDDAPGTAAATRALWLLAEACTPETRVAEFTQAIMDLGATVCTRANPACDRCPLVGGCGAFSMDRVAELPRRRRRTARRLRHTHMVFALQSGRVLLQRRPPRGIWGGLWAPPEFPDADSVRAWVISIFGTSTLQARRLPVLRHAFTHFDLDIEPWVLELGSAGPLIADSGSRWHELGAVHAVGLPAPVARLMKEGVDGQDGSMRIARPRGGGPRTRAVSG